MPPAAPRVSIAMPIRNGETHLVSAVQSLLAQTFGNFELLVSDNASTDATPDLLASFDDHRLRVKRRETTVAGITNFNDLLPVARGHYFMWAASDDLWEPEFLERLVGLLDSDAGAALGFCAFDNVEPEAPRVAVRKYHPNPSFASPDRFERMRAYVLDAESRGKANLIYGLFRRRHLAAIGGMLDWPTSRWGCDMLTLFRLLDLGRVAWADDTLFHKRLSPAEVAAVASPGIGPPVPLRQLPQWHGYLLGYLRIIVSTKSLTTTQRRRLVGAVLHKLAQGDRAAARRLSERLGMSRPPS